MADDNEFQPRMLTSGQCTQRVWLRPGFSAAAGLALINSIGNLSGFAGPYLIGFVGTRTGNL